MRPVANAPFSGVSDILFIVCETIGLQTVRMTPLSKIRVDVRLCLTVNGQHHY